MDKSDHQLLRRFVDSGDQAAFAALVNKHADLAYSAAFSRLNRKDLASDACQLTFMTLARKAARLSGETSLEGWIYTTARNRARNLQRSESRRGLRDRDYYETMMSAGNPDQDWAELRPEIHEAIDQLKPEDRNAILLRYFQNKSLARTGEALGLSEDAVRMRLKRALARMSSHLGRKGITSTAALLASALPSQALVAAPSGLASTITSTVLASTASAGLGSATVGASILLIMKNKIAIVAALFLAASTSTYFLKRENETEADPKESPSMQRVAVNAGRMDSSNVEDPDPAGAEDDLPDVFTIDPEYLQRGERMLAMFELTHGNPVLADIRNKLPDGSSPEMLATRLSLRLRLDEGQTEAVEQILRTNDEARRSHPIFGDQNTLTEGLLKLERGLAVKFLALTQMMGEKELRTPELEAYAAATEATAFRQMGFDPETFERKPVKPWDKNEETLEQLRKVLDPVQQEELTMYLNDEAGRKTEAKVFRRTMEVSRRLGLDEVDREALSDYLNEHPHASNDELKDILISEAHDLLEE